MAYTAADVLSASTAPAKSRPSSASKAVIRSTAHWRPYGSIIALGARYMTLTHTATLPWADAATDTPKNHGLAPFGLEVIAEMNRLGCVDLSHVSPDVMRQALAASKAPVMYSHSSAARVGRPSAQRAG
jgi:hypothetical protein